MPSLLLFFGLGAGLAGRRRLVPGPLHPLGLGSLGGPCAGLLWLARRGRRALLAGLDRARCRSLPADLLGRRRDVLRLVGLLGRRLLADLLGALRGLAWRVLGLPGSLALRGLLLLVGHLLLPRGQALLAGLLLGPPGPALLAPRPLPGRWLLFELRQPALCGCRLAPLCRELARIRCRRCRRLSVRPLRLLGLLVRCLLGLLVRCLLGLLNWCPLGLLYRRLLWLLGRLRLLLVRCLLWLLNWCLLWLLYRRLLWLLVRSLLGAARRRADLRSLLDRWRLEGLLDRRLRLLLQACLLGLWLRGVLERDLLGRLERRYPLGWLERRHLLRRLERRCRLRSGQLRSEPQSGGRRLRCRLRLVRLCLSIPSTLVSAGGLWIVLVHGYNSA